MGNNPSNADISTDPSVLNRQLIEKSVEYGMEDLLTETRMSWLNVSQKQDLLKDIDQWQGYEFYLKMVNLNNMMNKPSIMPTGEAYFYPALKEANIFVSFQPYRDLTIELSGKLLSIGTSTGSSIDEQRQELLHDLTMLINNKHKVTERNLHWLGDMLTDVWRLTYVREWNQPEDNEEIISVLRKKSAHYSKKKIPEVVFKFMKAVWKSLKTGEMRSNDPKYYLEYYDIVQFAAGEVPDGKLQSTMNIRNMLKDISCDKNGIQKRKKEVQFLRKRYPEGWEDIQPKYDAFRKSEYHSMITQPQTIRRRLPMIALLSELNLSL